MSVTHEWWASRDMTGEGLQVTRIGRGSTGYMRGGLRGLRREERLLSATQDGGLDVTHGWWGGVCEQWHGAQCHTQEEEGLGGTQE